MGLLSSPIFCVLSNFYPLPNDLYGFDIKVSYTSNKPPIRSLLFVYIIIISYLCERIHKTQYNMSKNKQFQVALLLIADGYVELMEKLKFQYNSKDHSAELEHPQLSAVRKFICTNVLKNDTDTIRKFDDIVKSLHRIYNEE